MNIQKTLTAIVAATTISFCFVSPFNGQTHAQSTQTQSTKNKVTHAGLKYLGTPYEYGSDRSNTRTFDCSDFTRQAVLDGLGIKIPSTASTQADYAKKVGKTTTQWTNLKSGDLMFFMSYKGPRPSSYAGLYKPIQPITHVGIYLGNGKVLHTFSKESGGVTVSKIDGTHWEYRFVFGGSIVG